MSLEGNSLLEKSFVAKADIDGYLIFKLDADGEVLIASAAADKSVGVTGRGGAKAGEHLAGHLIGHVPVKYGGSVARGDLLTANASGQAVATSAANARIIGVAMEKGVSGDVGQALLVPGRI